MKAREENEPRKLETVGQLAWTWTALYESLDHDMRTIALLSDQKPVDHFCSISPSGVWSKCRQPIQNAIFVSRSIGFCSNHYVLNTGKTSVLVCAVPCGKECPKSARDSIEILVSGFSQAGVHELFLQVVDDPAIFQSSFFSLFIEILCGSLPQALGS